MKTCTYCGRENEDTAALCRECGTDLQLSRSDSLSRINIRQRLAALPDRISRTQKRMVVCLGAFLAIVVTYIASGYLHRPRMSEAEVIQLANSAAATAGFRLIEYGTPRARFKFPDRDRTWRVMYDLRLPTSWGPPLPKPQSAHGAPRHIFVIVDDKTRYARIGMLQPVGAPESMKLPHGIKVLGYYTNQEWSDSNTTAR